jgi:hypothetical protein
LRAEVIDLVGINCFEHPPQSRSVGQIAVVQSQIGAAEMGVVVEMVRGSVLKKLARRITP